MCKLFMMTNAPKKINKKLLEVLKEELCLADKDGFGYATLSYEGVIGGERTDEPEEFSPLGPNPMTLKTSLLGQAVAPNYNQFGRITETNAKALMAHGRFSTNEKGLSNAHPFVSDCGEIALIHNGVVTDSANEVKDLLTTGCDTEILLRYWEKDQMQSIQSNVSGYYALGVMHDGLLHIIKDDRAQLFITYSRTADSFLVATTSSILKNVAKEMNWKIEPIMPIRDNQHMVFDGNVLSSNSTITPRAATWSRAAQDALHGPDKAPKVYGASNDYLYDREEGLGSKGWSEVMNESDDKDDMPAYRRKVIYA